MNSLKIFMFAMDLMVRAKGENKANFQKVHWRYLMKSSKSTLAMANYSILSKVKNCNDSYTTKINPGILHKFRLIQALEREITTVIIILSNID